MSEAKKKRRPVCGSHWRTLAWARRSRAVAAQSRGTAVFDELVIDDWFHLEQMDTRQWWMRVGDVMLWVTIARDGKARVTVDESEREPRRGR